MDFSISRDVFLKVLKAVSGVVDKKSAPGAPILSHVLLVAKGGVLSAAATDQEMEMISTTKLEDVSQEGAVAVSFRKLNDVCRTLTKSTVRFLNDGNGKVAITAGRSRFVLQALDATEYPGFSSTDEGIRLTVPARQLKTILDKTAFAMAEQDVRYFLNGMLLESEDGRLQVVATDGHRLVVNFLEVPGLPNIPRTIIPRKGVFEMLRVLGDVDEDVVLEISDKLLCLRTPWVSLSTRLLEGRFPDYKQVIPGNSDKLATGSRALLKDAFVRASALFSEKLRTIRLSFTGAGLKVLAHNAEHDQAEEDVELEYSGDELEIGFNVKYLLDFLSVVATDRVELSFSTPNHSAIVRGCGDDSSIYVIMPMRL